MRPVLHLHHLPHSPLHLLLPHRRLVQNPTPTPTSGPTRDDAHNALYVLRLILGTVRKFFGGPALTAVLAQHACLHAQACELTERSKGSRANTATGRTGGHVGTVQTKPHFQ